MRLLQTKKRKSKLFAEHKIALCNNEFENRDSESEFRSIVANSKRWASGSTELETEQAGPWLRNMSAGSKPRHGQRISHYDDVAYLESIGERIKRTSRSIRSRSCNSQRSSVQAPEERRSHHKHKSKHRSKRPRISKYESAHSHKRKVEGNDDDWVPGIRQTRALRHSKRARRGESEEDRQYDFRFHRECRQLESTADEDSFDEILNFLEGVAKGPILPKLAEVEENDSTEGQKSMPKSLPKKSHKKQPSPYRERVFMLRTRNLTCGQLTSAENWKKNADIKERPKMHKEIAVKESENVKYLFVESEGCAAPTRSSDDKETRRLLRDISKRIEKELNKGLARAKTCVRMDRETALQECDLLLSNIMAEKQQAGEPINAEENNVRTENIGSSEIRDASSDAASSSSLELGICTVLPIPDLTDTKDFLKQGQNNYASSARCLSLLPATSMDFDEEASSDTEELSLGYKRQNSDDVEKQQCTSAGQESHCADDDVDPEEMLNHIEQLTRYEGYYDKLIAWAKLHALKDVPVGRLMFPKLKLES